MKTCIKLENLEQAFLESISKEQLDVFLRFSLGDFFFHGGSGRGKRGRLLKPQRLRDDATLAIRHLRYRSKTYFAAD